MWLHLFKVPVGRGAVGVDPCMGPGHHPCWCVGSLQELFWAGMGCLGLAHSALSSREIAPASGGLPHGPGGNCKALCHSHTLPGEPYTPELGGRLVHSHPSPLWLGCSFPGPGALEPDPGICSQQTGSSQSNLSLLILYLTRQDPGCFHTGSPGSWEGLGRNSLSYQKAGFPVGWRWDEVWWESYPEVGPTQSPSLVALEVLVMSGDTEAQ